MISPGQTAAQRSVAVAMVDTWTMVVVNGMPIAERLGSKEVGTRFTLCLG